MARNYKPPVNDYYEWNSGERQKLAVACPSGHEVRPFDAVEINSTPPAPEPSASTIEVEEGSATETFIGRLRDFWNRK